MLGFLKVLKNKERLSGAYELRKTSSCIQFCAVLNANDYESSYDWKAIPLHDILLWLILHSLSSPPIDFPQSSHHGWFLFGLLLTNYLWNSAFIATICLMESTQWRDFALFIIVLWIVNNGFREEKCHMFSSEHMNCLIWRYHLIQWNWENQNESEVDRFKYVCVCVCVLETIIT